MEKKRYLISHWVKGGVPHPLAIEVEDNHIQGKRVYVIDLTDSEVIALYDEYDVMLRAPYTPEKGKELFDHPRIYLDDKGRYFRQR